MQKLPIIASLILPLSLAFGQVDSNSITVTSSRSPASSTPDQALFAVRVSSALNTGLDDVIAALQGSGITAANLQNLNEYSTSTGMTQTQMLDWWFTFPAPFAKNKDTITTLVALQAKIAQNNSGMTMSFSIQGTQSSVQPTACSLADLLTDARTQAQKLADGAGVVVGIILAMSSPTGTGPLVACTLTVKFGLLRY
jgi:uncharacterized protein YggE